MPAGPSGPGWGPPARRAARKLAGKPENGRYFLQGVMAPPLHMHLLDGEAAAHPEHAAACGAACQHHSWHRRGPSPHLTKRPHLGHPCCKACRAGEGLANAPAAARSKGAKSSALPACERVTEVFQCKWECKLVTMAASSWWAPPRTPTAVRQLGWGRQPAGTPRCTVRAVSYND